MALSGMRDVSHIDTAPSSRKPVETHITAWAPEAVETALREELAHGGQAFYVVPRIRDIPHHVEMLKDLLKGARKDGKDAAIAVAHGALPAGEAEEVLVRFAMRQGDVLVATTLIENGLDVPSVNTVVVAQAHKLGLASLYQLRGRVGRSEKQAFAFFFHPRSVQGEGKEAGKQEKGGKGDQVKASLSSDPALRKRQLAQLGGKSMTQEAVQRLAALKEYSHLLGMGPQLAKADLAIRGAGEVLGYEQSGDKGSGVGYDVYMNMLAEALVKVRGTAIEPTPYTEINLGDGLSNEQVLSSSFLPSAFFPNEKTRTAEIEEARLAPSFEKLRSLQKRWRVTYHCSTSPMPRSVRLFFIRLNLLLASRVLSGENLVLLKSSAAEGRARLVLVTRNLLSFHWDALCGALPPSHFSSRPSARPHPNLRRNVYFREGSIENGGGRLEEEEGEEEEKRDGVPRKGKRGCIVMELRDASMAAETALAVLFPFAEVILNQRESLAERIGQGRKGQNKAGG
ncbi:transcription-repair coupling factor [Nannochloropsis gaditana]|uniref:Transcription-repair coupling factor n=1 Tax=Nannochloropsis gaditana TaxID=72520 RepID=W7TTN2_9STRA|nr:transcription-repair coupling factor [Nannochloropsis gaditana]